MIYEVINFEISKRNRMNVIMVNIRKVIVNIKKRQAIIDEEVENLIIKTLNNEAEDKIKFDENKIFDNIFEKLKNK